MSESILDFHETFRMSQLRISFCQDVVLLSSFLERQETRIWFCSGKMSTWGFLNWMNLSYLACVLFLVIFLRILAMVNHHLFGRKSYVWNFFHKNHHHFSFTSVFLKIFFGGVTFSRQFSRKAKKIQGDGHKQIGTTGAGFPPLESSKKRSKNVGVWGGAVCKEQLFTERTNFTNNLLTYIGVMIDPCTKYQQGNMFFFVFWSCPFFHRKSGSFPLRSCEVFIQAAVKWCREPSSSKLFLVPREFRRTITRWWFIPTWGNDPIFD